MNNKKWEKKLKRLRQTGSPVKNHYKINGEILSIEDLIDVTECHNCGNKIAGGNITYGYCSDCVSNVETCPYCNEQSIVNEKGVWRCLECGKKVSENVMINPNQIMFDHDNNLAIFNSEDGIVYRFKEAEHDPDTGMLGKFISLGKEYMWINLNRFFL